MDNGHEPATKQDLAGVRQLRQDIHTLRSEMNHQYDDLKETIRDVQTEMLKAFYSFAESNQKRLAEMENESTIKSRLATIEDRLLQIERKVNFPNHPPHGYWSPDRQLDPDGADRGLDGIQGRTCGGLDRGEKGVRFSAFRPTY